MDELAKIGSNDVARLNHYKGHLPSEKKQGGSLRIADDAQHGDLVMRGYKRVGPYEGSSAELTRKSMSYYFAPVSGQAGFHQGVLQTVHQTVSGIDPQTGYTVSEVMAGRVTDHREVSAIARKLANQKATREQLLPVFDERGRLVAYERGADVTQLASLNRNTDLSEMIGTWRGRQAEELLAEESNKQLIDNLNDLWIQGRKDGRQNEFVNVMKLGPKEDPILKQAVGLIPNQAKAYLQNVFGADTLMVRRDMLLDTFGARQASVGDMFTNETRWNPTVAREFEKLAVGMFGKNAYVRLVGTERNVQELVANAKNLIVVKSVIVPAMNMVANMGQLLNRGVPLRHVLKGIAAKTAETNDYIKRRHREIGLEAELRAATARQDIVKMRKLGNEIRSIQDSYKRMSIWPLIEAGEFSATGPLGSGRPSTRSSRERIISAVGFTR